MPFFTADNVVCNTFYLILVLLLSAAESKLSCTEESNLIKQDVTNFDDSYLCRMCGHQVATDPQSFELPPSPFALETFNETFNCQKTQEAKTVSIQRLKNPANLVFDVIAARQSDCIPIGKWDARHSWYPGYSWKSCLCSHCGKFLGWAFEPDDRADKESAKPSRQRFYLLIVDHLLRESAAQAVTTFVPKLFRQ